MRPLRRPIRRRILWLGGILHLLLVTTVLPEELMWDEAALLINAEHFILGDLAHFLYTPTLVVASWILAPFTDNPDTAGRLLSATASALAFVFLWRFLSHAIHAPPWLACVAASMYTTSPAFWQQSVRVEVYTLAVAFLLLSANGAWEFRRRGGLGPAIWTIVGLGLSCAMHITAILAIPWIALLATRRTKNLIFLVLGAEITLGSAVLLLWLVTPITLETFIVRVRGYAPAPEDHEALLALAENHIHRVTIIFSDGAPVYSLLAGFSLLTVLAWRKKRHRELLLTATLAIPFLSVFLFFGTSFLGLLLPFLAALSIPMVLGLRTISLRYRKTRLVELSATVILVFQIASSYRMFAEDAQIEDDSKSAARILEENLPRASFLIAAQRSQHIRLWTSLTTYSLPDTLHMTLGRGEDPLQSLRDLLLSLKGHKNVFITERALEYLEEFWEIRPSEIPFDPTSHWTLRQRPRLAVYRIRLTP